MLEFAVDGSGGLAARIDNNKFITLLPITLYQGERYVWENAPERLEVDRLINLEKRASPDDLNISNFAQIFLSGFSYLEASEICKLLLRGRLPSENEWDFAHINLLCRRGVFSHASSYIDSLCKECQVDMRMRKIYGFMASIESRVRILNPMAVLVTEYPARPENPHGRIYAKSWNGARALVTGVDFSPADVCFHAIIEQ